MKETPFIMPMCSCKLPCHSYDVSPLDLIGLLLLCWVTFMAKSFSQLFMSRADAISVLTVILWGAVLDFFNLAINMGELRK